MQLMCFECMNQVFHCFSFQNPSKPHFNHYLFESLCLSVRITCKANPTTVSSFEEALFPVFTEILQNDVQGSILLLSNELLFVTRLCHFLPPFFFCRISSVCVPGDVSPFGDPLQLHPVFLYGLISPPAAAGSVGADGKHPPSGAAAPSLPGEGRSQHRRFSC